MKKAKKITIFVAIGMVVLGVGMAFVAMAAGGFDINKIIQTTTYTERVFDLPEDYSDISLQIRSQNLEILKSEDNVTHFICYEADDEIFTAEIKDDTLVVENKEKETKGLHFVLGGTIESARLYLPKEQYESLNIRVSSGGMKFSSAFTFEDVDIDLGSGAIDVSKITAEDINAHTNSGSLTLADVKAKSASFDTGSGAIKANNTDIDTMLDLHTSSGSITCDSVTCDNAKMKTGSGKIELVNTDCGTNLEIHTSSGSIILNDVVAQADFNAKTGSGKIELTSCDGANMDLHTGSGSIKGSLKTPKMFEAKSGSGSVDVPGDDSNGGKCLIKTGSGSIDITIIPQIETEQ
ncbi:MAG: DUF4097 family beta strand repeat protein [Lachnospiraceae bacterium]|nr:DUF4097 family beta strand repeat protein [Lachnospiraceae bacterium]